MDKRGGVLKIAIVGTGYVGLVTGTCFAETGNSVICIDIDEDKVNKMQQGKVPIYEPDLEKLFQKNVEERRLYFTSSLKEGVKEAEIIFLALPTPPIKDGSADLSYILAVADNLGKLLKHYAIIVNKSTVPVGATELVREHIAKNANVEFDVVSNPEFLREGFAVSDFMKPDRVVVGVSSNRAKKKMEELYKPFVQQGNTVFFMDERSSEMTKYAANSFLATKISFMNEIANLCEKVGADVDAVRLGIGSDKRIGKRFLFPGIGYGGSCFPKDVKALQNTANKHDYDLTILSAVGAVNERQKQRLAQKISRYYNDKLEDKTFALWGLAFKPDTDDIREAPALAIIKTLTSAGAKIIAYDPKAMDNVRKHRGDNKYLGFVKNKYDALRGADALVIATEWNEFRTADLVKIKRLLKQSVIFDGRNLYDLDIMKKEGFYYESIGRGVVNE